MKTGSKIYSSKLSDSHPDEVYNGFSVFHPTNKNVVTLLMNNTFGESAAVLVALTNVLETIVSTNDINKESYQFSFFPNPVSPYAQIEFNLPQTSDIQVKVYDVNGMLVKNEQLDNLPSGENNLSIPISDFTEGMYVLKISGKYISPINHRFVVTK